PLHVVRVINSVLLIKPRALIEDGLINEINRHPLLAFKTPNLAMHPPRGEWKIQGRPEQLQFGNSLANSSIQRRDDAYLVAGARQSFCHRPHHIRQPARFRIRMNFAAGEEDFHENFKLQIPNSREISTSNFQEPSPRASRVWSLELEASLELGC